MSKRLQVLMEEREYREVARAAKQQRMTVAEWVRQALREARRDVSATPVEAKMRAVREAMRHDYPTGDIEQVNEEIERGHRQAAR